MKIIKLLDDLRCDVEIEGQRYGDPVVVRNKKMDSADILAQFGLKPSSPIPPEYEGNMMIGNTRVCILKKSHPTAPKKRVFAKCRVCLRWFGAGHYDQHLRVCQKRGCTKASIR